jgi:hypothetical protein
MLDVSIEIGFAGRPGKLFALHRRAPKDQP